MTDLPEKTEYEPGIYQLETTDPVMAGPEGIDNLQAKQLANRTAWLKQQGTEIITAAGLMPDANNLEQLAAAINTLAVARAQELLSGHNTAATTGAAGHVELATKAEAVAGVSNLKAVTLDLLQYAIPVGTTIAIAATTSPDGYIPCNGTALLKSEFPELYAVIGGTFGETDTHFNVADMRGEFIRGWDDGRGIDAQRALGSWQSSSHTTIDNNSDDARGIPDANWATAMGWEPSTLDENGNYSLSLIASGGNLSYTSEDVGDFTKAARVRNVAHLICIKI